MKIDGNKTLRFGCNGKIPCKLLKQTIKILTDNGADEEITKRTLIKAVKKEAIFSHLFHNHAIANVTAKIERNIPKFVRAMNLGKNS